MDDNMTAPDDCTPSFKRRTPTESRTLPSEIAQNAGHNEPQESASSARDSHEGVCSPSGFQPERTRQQTLISARRVPLKRAPPSRVLKHFLSKVAAADGAGCREWRGPVWEDGYGRFLYRGKTTLAHRTAWTLQRGPIPETYEVDHTCFNTRCVAVEHLEPVTGTENRRRATVAGRMRHDRVRPVGERLIPGTDTKVTPRQLAILTIIAGRVQRLGSPPTIREIGAEMRIRSTNGVNDHLKALERKRLIRRSDWKARTIEVTDLGFRTLGVRVDQHRCAACGQSLAPDSIPTPNQSEVSHGHP